MLIYSLLFISTVTLSKHSITTYIIPHTHVDPGWLDTYDEYYDQKVKKIISNVVQYLTKHPNMKFTWCETCYLARWWADSSVHERGQFA